MSLSEVIRIISLNNVAEYLIHRIQFFIAQSARDKDPGDVAEAPRHQGHDIGLDYVIQIPLIENPRPRWRFKVTVRS